MKRDGVWSFRTATGSGRVVDGSLRTRHTLRGLTLGTYRRGNWKSLLRHLLVGFGSFSLFGSAADLVRAILSGSTGGVSALGVVSLAALVGMVGTLCLPLLNRSSAVVDIYDIVDVTVDTDDCELTIQYVDEDGDRETATVELADEKALGEAVSILKLKGAPVDEALVEEWAAAT